MEFENDALRVVNEWLGWGDPERGLWFIGLEEGKIFTEQKILSMRGKTFEDFHSGEDPRWPVAVGTANVVCRLTGLASPAIYRRSRMWRKGSKVFSGNLLPLGKPSLASWPESYEALFGLTSKDYLGHYGGLKTVRHKRFREFRTEWQPQAIVCYGKTRRSEFEEVFAANKTERMYAPEVDIVVYESERLILTPHFSYGWMPSRAVDYLVSTLKRWNVTIPLVVRRTGISFADRYQDPLGVRLRRVA